MERFKLSEKADQDLTGIYFEHKNVGGILGRVAPCFECFHKMGIFAQRLEKVPK